MKFILGTKIEMTQVYKGDIAVPVTKVQMLPGVVMQIKTAANDGYDAVVVGFGERRAKNIAKPQLGAMKGLGTFRYIKEFRALTKAEVADISKLTRGNQIQVETFEEGDEVKVVGTSKGKGFQGGVKRHRFAGHKTTHGTKDQVRMPGSIGAGEPQHVFKGTRMAGHMGDQQVTVSNLKVVDVNAEEGVMMIKGALPGARHSVLYITAPGELKFTETAVVKEAKVEAAPVEEAKAESVAVEPAAETSVEEASADVAKEEAKVEEVKAEEAVAEEVKAEEVKIEDHVAKFKALPADEQAKYSSEAIQSIVSKLEEEYKIDLVPVVMKLAVKELSAEGLVAYFTETAKLEAAKAEELAKTIKEQILK